MAKVLGLKQLLGKKYTFLEPLPDGIKNSFGSLVTNFVMIVWGDSGNGKSSFLMQFIKALMPFGKILYVALEEGFEATTQMNVLRNLSAHEHAGKIEFADSEMKYDELVKKLHKKKSPRFIIIDSIQYWDMNYTKYKALKETFPKKTFIFISHADGKLPSGKTAKDVRYDAGVKVFIQGFVCFILSRYGGNVPYVIWEEGAKKYWGKEYKKIIKGIELEQHKILKDGKEEENKKQKDTALQAHELLEEPEQLVLGD